MKKPKKAKPRRLPPRALLHEKFEYDFDTGVLIWKEGNRKGKEAGYQTKQGYKIVGLKIKGRRVEFKQHRIIYYMFTGDPLTNKVVDHIDGDKANNRLNNLRAVTHRENSQNTCFTRSCGIIPEPDKRLAYFF